MTDEKTPPADASTPDSEAPASAKPKDNKKRPRKKAPRRAAAKPATHQGKVVKVEGDQAFVELGPKVSGIIALSEFESAPEVGAEYEFSFVNIGTDGVWNLSRQEAHAKEIWDTVQPGARFTAKVIGQNTGGLELKIGPVSAFMPASQVALHGKSDLSEYFGRELECEVMEVNRRRRRIVLSRRMIEQKAAQAERAEALKHLETGTVVDGKVARLEPFGAIVTFGEGLSGLLHVTNISHSRVNKPADVLSVGQEVKVQVLEIKEGGKRIGLGMKQLAEDPWADIERRFPTNKRLEGEVTRVADFGAFVKLEDGIEGLLHISQLSPERVSQVSDVVKSGEKFEVRVVNVDRERRRLGLSRLTQSGALIGSEDDTGDDDVGDMLLEEPAQRGTNLGDVLRRALEGK